MAVRRINADKSHLWKADVAASVDQFNQWFLRFAPEAFRSTRLKTTEHVKAALLATDDLRALNAAILNANPGALPTLRMCTAPPLAVDRLIGLAGVNKNLVGRMEAGKLPARIQTAHLDAELTKLCNILSRLLDRDIFPWLDSRTDPTDHQRDRASTIVADRLCRGPGRDRVRCELRAHQLRTVVTFLKAIGYCDVSGESDESLTLKGPGTFLTSSAVLLGWLADVCVTVDIIVQPIRRRRNPAPMFIDVVCPQNVREASRQAARCVRKWRRLRLAYGEALPLMLILGGCVDAGVLGTFAAESADWVWQHRLGGFAEVIGCGTS